MSKVNETVVMYEVPEKYLQTLLDYLAGRPYKEVHGLVRLIQSLQPKTQPQIEPKLVKAAEPVEVPAQTN